MRPSHPSRTLRASLALAALGASLIAHATEIVQKFDFGMERTSWTHTATLAKFDTALGTLTGIEFSLTGTLQTDMSLANLSMSSVNTVTGTVNGTFSLKSGTATYVTGAVSISHQGTYGKSLDGLTPDFTGGRGEVFARDTRTNTYTSGSNSASVLTLFKGGPNDKVAFDVSTGSTSSSTSNAGNRFFDADTFGASSGYVRYTYTAVPEPASFVSFGLGTLALLGRRRKGGRA